MLEAATEYLYQKKIEQLESLLRAILEGRTVMKQEIEAALGYPTADAPPTLNTHPPVEDGSDEAY